MEKHIDFSSIIAAVEYCKSRSGKPAVTGMPPLFQPENAPQIQALLNSWAGVSPQQFARFVSIELAKEKISQAKNHTIPAVYGAAHNSLISILPMLPEEYHRGGAGLQINYCFAETPFGSLMMAATTSGICYAAFYDGSQEQAFAEMKKQFPQAAYHQLLDRVLQNALFFFTRDWKKLNRIVLHVKGTRFQVKVWEALLGIPVGALSTYATIAAGMQHPKASRAVGSAVGDNPVAFLIPCHRVVKSTGDFGQYHWGILRKTAMIGWEATRIWMNTKN